MVLRWAWVLGALLSFAPESLWARPEIHVLIAAEGAWPQGIEKTLREASNRLAQSDLVLIPVPEKRSEPPEADAWLEKAESALGQLDLDAAQEAHNKALEAFSQCAKLQRPMSDLFLSRALLFYAQGNNPAVKKELAAAAVLDPTLSPDPIRYPPKLLRLYQEALQETSKRPTASIEVLAPAGTTIWIDGLLYEAPQKLPLGAHYLRAERSGFFAFIQKVNLSSSGAYITVNLEADLFAQDQARRVLAAKDPSAVTLWASAEGIRELIIVTPTPTQWQLFWLNTQEQRTLGQANTSLEQLAGALLGLVEPPAPFSLPIIEGPLPNDERVVWRSPAFWVPAGLFLLSGVVLLSFDLINDQNGARPSIDLRVRP